MNVIEYIINMCGIVNKYIKIIKSLAGNTVHGLIKLLQETTNYVINYQYHAWAISLKSLGRALLKLPK